MPNFTFSHLIQTHPSTDFTYAAYAFAFIMIMFLGSFILHFIRKKYIHNSSLKKVLRSTSSQMWWIALTALLMTWTRLEGIAYISMRIWWLVLVLIIIFLIARTWKKYIDMECKKKRFEVRNIKGDTKKKYLPKLKKKK
ncbi:hypothetical protein HON22_04730 [Candidatus Peregrinibacteria bacterium]|jgi:hypothetical protein|nr:hypothetical protein [Candidatus Peregrinibacteria bacterium]